MKYFKTIAFLLSVFALSISCSQRDSFRSLGDENEQFLGSEDNPEHRKEIQNLVNQKKIVKIGGKKSSNSINLSETVGQNHLKNQEDKKEMKKRTPAASSSDNKMVSDSSSSQDEKLVTIELGIKGSAGMEEADPTKSLSLLFYIHDKRSYCVRQFKKYNSYFLDSLNKAPHWDIAFSFHRDNQELMELQRTKRNQYILSKGAKDANIIFSSTIGAQYSEAGSSDRAPSHINPLQGLDQTLEVFADKEGPKVVIYIDAFFPYYSAKEWKDFYAKHEDLTILVIAQRNATLSNLNTGFNAGVDLVALPGCNFMTQQFVENALEHIMSKLN